MMIVRRKEETHGAPDPLGMMGRGAVWQRGSSLFPSSLLQRQGLWLLRGGAGSQFHR